MKGIRPRQILPLGREASQKIRNLIFSGDPGVKDYIDLANELHDKFCKKSAKFVQALQLIMDIAYTIDQEKVLYFGFDFSTEISNNLIKFFIDRFSFEINYDLNDLDDLRKFVDFLKISDGWLVPKVMHLEHILSLRASTILWINELSVPDAKKSYQELCEDIFGIDEEINNTMNNLEKLRKYGVKSCYFEDRLLHESEDCWTFYDFTELEELFPQGVYKLISKNDRYLALVCLGKKQAEVGAHISKEVFETKEWKVIGSKLPMKAYFIWCLDSTGHLWVHNGFFDEPLRNLFLLAKKPYEYELVRLYFVMRFYDLVVPCEIVDRLPPFSSLDSQPKENQGRRSRAIISSELIIPRIKKIKELPEVINCLRREILVFDRETQERSRRKHEVINHVRRLPKGYKSSLDARVRAWKEIGVVLGDNETYVRRHERGQEGEVTLPKAKIRS